jgi:hypothetical protein
LRVLAARFSCSHRISRLPAALWYLLDMPRAMRVDAVEGAELGGSGCTYRGSCCTTARFGGLDSAGTKSQQVIPTKVLCGGGALANSASGDKVNANGGGRRTSSLPAARRWPVAAGRVRLHRVHRRGAQACPGRRYWRVCRS